MAQAGAFETVSKKTVSALSYVLVGTAAKEEKITFDKGSTSIETVAAGHIAGLTHMLNQLRRGEEAFISRRMPEKIKDGGSYDHLARVKEWLTDTSD